MKKAFPEQEILHESTSTASVARACVGFVGGLTTSSSKSSTMQRITNWNLGHGYGACSVCAQNLSIAFGCVRALSSRSQMLPGAGQHCQELGRNLGILGEAVLGGPQSTRKLGG